MTLTAEQLRAAREVIGAQLKKLREQQYWTLQELADKVGVSASTVHRIETGELNPTLSQFITVQHSLGHIVAIESKDSAGAREILQEINQGVYPISETE